MALWTTTIDNIIRVLSGLKPAPTFWCKVGVHHWTRWDIAHTRIRDGQYSWSPKVKVEEFKRECRDCGNPQNRILRNEL